ncbi:MAG: hypothetical protein H6900_11120 [Rhodobacter sp.]|uniref:hypothetical protein n=1 Tax=Pararhodobacter sp. TaxID=2127056 RepID=UPI001D214489|nr:hypothetical protein [Pararhodobacter sp.]MCB1345386.1 hypothetical protein [Paracoccaceae bacterium]MCC0073825.1 hypothetical protein [Rhodobacter sp.]HPD92609.1 hypothetical protein [Pararhodobacter sp.]
MTSDQTHRTQTGVRLSTPMLKTLKALADYRDLSLGDLLEGIVLHAFDGKDPFTPETRAVIEQLRAVYGCTWRAQDSHRHSEAP